MLYDLIVREYKSGWQKYTNSPSEWYQLDLDITNSVLFYGNDGQPKDLDSFLALEGLDESTYIFVVGKEGCCDQWTKLRDNIYVWDSTFSKHNDDHFIPYFFWFNAVIEVDKHMQATKKLISYSNKPRTQLFDCLLGRKKEHRDYVYNTVKNDTKLSNQVYITYFGITGKWNEGNSSDNMSLANIKASDHGRSYRKDLPRLETEVSSLLPYELYNETFYSIVTETSYQTIFLTEKTAKPIIAKRLFIIIGAHSTLKGLKSIGFKTFDSIIDESYDDEPNDEKRWKLAMQQVKYLSTQDPYKICKEIESVVEHNKRCLIEKCNLDIVFSQISKIAHKG